MKPRHPLDGFDEDIRDHIDRETRENVERGLAPEEARRRAMITFGNVALAREDTRAVWIPRWAEQTIQDVRYAARRLVHAPAFSSAVVLTLTLGIGANTAIFSLFQAIVVEPLPVSKPDTLVLFTDSLSEGTWVTSTAPEGQWELFSTEAYRFLQQQSMSFESLAAVRSGETTVLGRLPGTGDSERIRVHLVSGNYFEVLGVEATIGRTLAATDDEERATPVAVVSHDLWTDRLGADPAAIGRVATLGDMAVTVVGVVPEGFFGERVRRPPDFWVPLLFQPQIEQQPSRLDQPDVYWLSLIGRLAPGATRAGAESATTTALQQFLIDRAGDQVTDQQLQAIRTARVTLFGGARGISYLRQRYAEPLMILLGVAALVLVIACANVGNLLLACAGVRRPEISMRAALGASRERLVRQLMVEIFFLAALGAGGGLLLARWAVDGLLALMAGPTTPVEVGLDGTVFLFTLAVTLAAATLSGLAPAMFTTRADLVAALKTRFMPAPDRGTSGPLVVCQIAVCLVLVVGASLLARSLQALERQDIGFHADDVLVSRIYPRMVGYEPERVGELYRRLQERLAALPGVRSVTIARYSPFSGTSSRNSGSVEEYTPRSGEDVTLETIQVGASYPETLGIPLVLGRAIGPLDATGGARVGMVNQAFVRRYLPDGNPLGRRFSIGGEVPDTEIVGVVGDVQFHNVRDEVEPMVFVPWLAAYGQFVLDAEVAVRTTTHGGATPEDIRRAIRDVDGSLPLEGPRPLYNQIANSFQIERLFARFVGAFSALALVLACVGLCGLVTQGVSRRTQEIGLRMALGAQRRQILWMILRRALRLVAVGLLIGVPAAFGASQLLASVLFGVTPADPASFVLGVTALGSVGTMAVLIPACRAARVDPLVALRSE